MICPRADFIAAWRSSETLADVGRATGLAPNTCRRKASTLRAEGVDLPYMRQRRGRETLKTWDRVRLGAREGRVVMSEHSTGLVVIAWDDGTTDTATRRGAIYVERI